MDGSIRRWASMATQYVGVCWDAAMASMDDRSPMDSYVRLVSSRLFIGCHISSESALLLAGESREWDADILNRSVMEGTLKLVYMLLGTKEEVRQKAFEYWEILPNNGAARHSERAKALLDDVPDSESPQWDAMRELLLSNDEVEELRAGSNRQERSQLEQRWSFSGIAQYLATHEITAYRGLAHLAHGYGMSSHLLHKDSDGVGMIWERMTRPHQRQRAVALGHLSRVIEDICCFADLRAWVMLKYCGIDTSHLRKTREDFTELFSELEVALRNFTDIEYGFTGGVASA